MTETERVVRTITRLMKRLPPAIAEAEERARKDPFRNAPALNGIVHGLARALSQATGREGDENKIERELYGDPDEND